MRRLAAAMLLAAAARADFIYADFNETAGLAFNGAATTSSCDAGTPFLYEASQGVNDAYDAGALPPLVEETTDTVTEQTAATFERADAVRTTRFLAGFPHADFAGKPPLEPSPDGCALRLRLTAARPFQRGSVMRLEAAPVLNGFEVGFSFQASDQSQSCTLVKDAAFGERSHRLCSIRGGDGLAFVIHRDANGSAALGEGGSGLGFAGIGSGIAVEFDAWYNGGMAAGAPARLSEGGGLGAGTAAGAGVGGPGAAPGGAEADRVEDHVSLHASRPAAGARLTQGLDTQLGAARLADVADGQVHTVRVVYWPHLNYALVPRFTAGAFSASLLRDEGDGRRLGTLAVYVDDLDPLRPLLATPVNLNTALQLPDDRAYMGFTAATGSAWQKHDVLDWYFCEVPGCPLMRGALGDPALAVKYSLDVPSSATDAAAVPPEARRRLAAEARAARGRALRRRRRQRQHEAEAAGLEGE
jgi:hypothetical protein